MGWGQSNTENQYLFEIQVNGLTCTRLYNSMGWALLDEVHPVEQEYDVHHTYKCDDKEICIYLVVPFITKVIGGFTITLNLIGKF
jgi:hypothetical protein